jgi:hypothetical protein
LTSRMNCPAKQTTPSIRWADLSCTCLGGFRRGRFAPIQQLVVRAPPLVSAGLASPGQRGVPPEDRRNQRALLPTPPPPDVPHRWLWPHPGRPDRSDRVQIWSLQTQILRLILLLSCLAASGPSFYFLENALKSQVKSK